MSFPQKAQQSRVVVSAVNARLCLRERDVDHITEKKGSSVSLKNADV